MYISIYTHTHIYTHTYIYYLRCMVLLSRSGLVKGIVPMSRP